jgi:hypothetical protein
VVEEEEVTLEVGGEVVVVLVWLWWLWWWRVVSLRVCSC